MSSSALAALVVAVGLGGVHLLAGRLRFLDVVPRSRLLSVAGGISVAYVFVHLLPEIAEGQEELARVTDEVLPAAERHAYLLALAGLALFYGVDRLAVHSRHRQAGSAHAEHHAAEPGVFAFATASFAVYNALIGYLAVQRAEAGGGPDWSLALFAVALGVHFLVNDVGLRRHHKHRYDGIGRWILAPAPLVGWVVGVQADVSEALVAAVVAFLGGGIVLNVLKEELPEEQQSRFWAFAGGGLAYALVLLAI